MVTGSTTWVAIPLGDGRWIVLSQSELAEGLERAAAIPALSSPMKTVPGPAPVAEPWVDSRQLAKLTGVGSTTLETLAAQRAIPAIRVGRLLRFKLSEVEAALRARKQ